MSGTEGFPTESVYALLALVAFLVVVGLWVLVVWQRERYRVLDLRAELGHDVETGTALLERRLELCPELPANATALADARDRLAAARTQRAAGPEVPVSRVCRRMLLEGLAAVREAERLAGRDPGPALPPPTDAPLVPSAVRVPVGSVEHLALPAYAPGHRYCYSGGLLAVDGQDVEVPGGWYAEPFWEPLLAADPDRERVGPGSRSRRARFPSRAGRG